METHTFIYFLNQNFEILHTNKMPISESIPGVLYICVAEHFYFISRVFIS